MMMYHPNVYEEKAGAYILPPTVCAKANGALCKPIFKEFFSGHAFRLSHLETQMTDALVFLAGEAKEPSLNGEDYAVNVEPTGFCVKGKTERDLIYGFMMLLDAMVCEKRGEVKIPCFFAAHTPKTACRMVHFCVFPDTELWEIEKFVRYAGALCYTHLVIEFWGTFRFACEPTFSWKNAYTKEELAPILVMARDLGMEIVPMLNHWGHASGSRVMHGKHASLDTDPTLACYFSPDGWRFSIEREETRALLKKLRGELIELCGEGSYFHIGCDEAYGFRFTDESMKEMCDYFASLADDLAKENRRALIWGDMFLYKHPEYIEENRYDANAPTLAAEEQMLARLDRRLLIADWQYNVQKYPVETSLLFQKHGFDVICCPWQNATDIAHCVRTVEENGLCGVMHTTWHTLSAEMHQVLRTALLSIQGGFNEGFVVHTGAAALLRKVYFADGDYRRAGWAKHEVGVIC